MIFTYYSGALDWRLTMSLNEMRKAWLEVS